MNKENKNKLENMKNEIASELGVDLKSKDLKASEAGKVGGQMTKELVEAGKNTKR